MLWYNREFINYLYGQLAGKINKCLMHILNWEPEGRYQYSRCSIENQKGVIAVHSLRVGCKPAAVFYTGFKKKIKYSNSHTLSV